MHRSVEIRLKCPRKSHGKQPQTVKNRQPSKKKLSAVINQKTSKVVDFVCEVNMNTRKNKLQSQKTSLNPIGLIVFVLIAIPALCPAQSHAEKNQKSAEITLKIHQLGLLQKFLPINFTAKELDAILDQVEVARSQVRKTEDNAYKTLLPYESAVDKAIKNALDKYEVPDHKLAANITHDLLALQQTEQLEAVSNVAIVFKAVEKVCDAGQKNLMANEAVNMPAKATKKQKIRAFVNEFLLDPVAYPMLVKMDVKLHQGAYPKKHSSTSGDSSSQSSSSGSSK